jgi:UDP-N-acetylmuramate--alanine ligase
MKIFISGISGSGMSGIAQLCLDLGFLVFGSDLEENQMSQKLIKQGAKISFSQSLENIQNIHNLQKIDWFIHSSSIKPESQEYQFAKNQGLKISKRDGFLNFLLQEKNLKLIAIAGTHGKTTTTAMLVWLFKYFNIPVSYLIGTDLSWAKKASYEKTSKFFILEADEYDKNFLSYNSEYSIITSLEYDHPDTYPLEIDYFQAFYDFLLQVKKNKYLFQEDFLKISNNVKNFDQQKLPNLVLIKKTDINWSTKETCLNLAGIHNRQNAFLVKKLFNQIQPYLKTNFSTQEIDTGLNNFAGTFRRFEKLNHNLYTDYAHHPTEILATLQLASELSNEIIAVYQPHQNLRQAKICKDYKDVFEKAEKVYWLETFLTREDPSLEIIKAKDLAVFSNHKNLELAKLDTDLKEKIEEHLESGKLVLFMGAGNIDTWVRDVFALKKEI